MKYTHTHNLVNILKSQVFPVGKFPINSITDGAARYSPLTEEIISAPTSEAVKGETRSGNSAGKSAGKQVIA